MSFSRRTLVQATALGGLSGLAAPFLSNRALAADEIRIGALCELSGTASTIGTQQARGIELAVEEINRTGGILGSGPGIDGRPLKLLTEDTETKVATGLARAKKLVERDNVHALTGIVFSSISLGIQEYVNKSARIPFINSGSSSTAIAEPPACGRFSFQSQPSARAYVMPALDAAKAKGKRWFFIADDYPWGRLSVQLMKQAIGREVALETVGEEYPPLGTATYAPYISKIAAARPDVIGIVVFGAGYARVLKQLGQMGIDAHKHHYFWSQVDALAAGEAAVGMTAAETYTYENPTVPRAAAFASAFRARYGEWPDPVAARAYTAVELLALAFKAAGGTAPEKVVDALEAVRHGSVIGDLAFRACDHVAEAPVFMIEGRRSDTYQLYPAFVRNVADPQALAIPCGQTGCEPAMKS